MIDPSFASSLTPLASWRLRRKMRRHAGQRGLIVLVDYGLGPIWVAWPNEHMYVGVQVGREVYGYDKFSVTPKWYPIPEEDLQVQVRLGKRPLIDVTRPGLDPDKGLVLYVSPYKRSGKRGRAILVQNTATESD